MPINPATVTLDTSTRFSTQDIEELLLMAHFATDAYRGAGDQAPFVFNDPPEGWQVLATAGDGKVVVRGQDSGALENTLFQATAYRKDGQIVISYRGTDDGAASLPAPAGELLAVSVPLGFGVGEHIPLGLSPISTSSFLTDAYQFYDTVLTAYPGVAGINAPDPEITFTGHSLGAMLAGVMSALFDRPALGFAPGPTNKALELALTQDEIRIASEIATAGAAPNFDKFQAYRLLGEILGDVSDPASLALAVQAYDLLAPDANTILAGTILALGLATNAQIGAEFVSLGDAGPAFKGTRDAFVSDRPGEFADPILLHSMPMHFLTLYGDEYAAPTLTNGTGYKTVDGFMRAFVGGELVTDTTPATTPEYLTQFISDPDPFSDVALFFQIVQSVYNGNRDLLGPLLTEIDKLVPLASDANAPLNPALVAASQLLAQLAAVNALENSNSFGGILEQTENGAAPQYINIPGYSSSSPRRAETPIPIVDLFKTILPAYADVGLFDGPVIDFREKLGTFIERGPGLIQTEDARGFFPNRLFLEGIKDAPVTDSEIIGTSDNDIIFARDALDTAETPKLLVNTIRGGDGDDVLIGGTFLNKLYGEDGNDVFFSRSHDEIDGGLGARDTVFFEVPQAAVEFHFLDDGTIEASDGDSFDDIVFSTVKLTSVEYAEFLDGSMRLEDGTGAPLLTFGVGPTGVGEAIELSAPFAPGTTVDISAAFVEGLDIEGETVTSLSISENGIHFNNPNLFSFPSSFLPFSLSGPGVSTGIYPFLTQARFDNVDLPIDTSDGGSFGTGKVYVHQDVANSRVVITYDDLLPDVPDLLLTEYHLRPNSYQVVLTDRSQDDDGTAGNFDITFRYFDIEYTGVSSSHDGLGGQEIFVSPDNHVAVAGYVLGSDIVELPVSGKDVEIRALDVAAGNTGQPGLWHFEIRNDTPVELTAGPDVAEESGDNVEFTFSLRNALTGPFEVDYILQSSSPLLGDLADLPNVYAPEIQDFSGIIPETITVGGASDEAVIRFAVIDDDRDEGTEELIATIIAIRDEDGNSIPIRRPETATVKITESPDDFIAVVSGDPHLTTLDGLGYDFHAVGEFTLLETTSGTPLEIQIRTVPVGDVASSVSAVAICFGGVRITYDIARDTPLLVNGLAQSLTDGQSFAVGGGSITRQGESYQVNTDGGDTITLTPGTEFLNVIPTISGTRAENVRGLLGNGDGATGNDLALPDGTVLPQPMSFAALYQVYGAAWRISEVNALFDRFGDETTADFTDLSFPRGALDLSELPSEIVTTAEAIVDAAGITDPTLRAQAIFDVVISGNPEFAEAYADLPAPEGTFVPTDTPTLTTVGVLAGDDIAEDGIAIFDIFRTGDTSQATTFGYALGGDIDASDLQTGTLAGTVSFEIDETTKRITIALVDDDAEETDETLTLTLDPGATTRSAPAGTLVVEDNDRVVTNNAPQGTVAIIGILTEGETLTADISGVSDADVIRTETLSFQWQRNGTDIPNATSASYTVTEDDALEALSVVVGYTDNGDTVESVASAQVTPAALGKLLQGDDAAEMLVGGKGADTILGAGGEDTLEGGAGNDILGGGSGIDRAVYDGPKSGYTLILTPGGTTLTDRRADGSGSDTLTGLEFLDFDGANSIEVLKQVGITGLGSADLESFVELYIAYFNRAPDAEGLGFWGTAFANGFSLGEIAGLFIDQPETRATYPSDLSNEDFATAVYNNVLGRVPDQTGFDFWVGALDSGGVSRDQFILSVLGGAKVDPPTTATQDFIDQQLIDRQYLSDKTDIGAYFSIHKGMSDVADAAAAMALFDGSSQSITAAVNAIAGFYTDALDAENGEFLLQLVGVIDDPFMI